MSSSLLWKSAQNAKAEHRKMIERCSSDWFDTVSHFMRKKPAVSGQLSLRRHRPAPAPMEDREKHAFSVRDLARHVSYSHYVCDQGDVGRDLRRASGAGPAVRAGQWLCGQARGVL